VCEFPGAVGRFGKRLSSSCHASRRPIAGTTDASAWLTRAPQSTNERARVQTYALEPRRTNGSVQTRVDLIYYYRWQARPGLRAATHPVATEHRYAEGADNHCAAKFHSPARTSAPIKRIAITAILPQCDSNPGRNRRTATNWSRPRGQRCKRKTIWIRRDYRRLPAATIALSFRSAGRTNCGAAMLALDGFRINYLLTKRADAAMRRFLGHQCRTAMFATNCVPLDVLLAVWTLSNCVLDVRVFHRFKLERNPFTVSTGTAL